MTRRTLCGLLLAATTWTVGGCFEQFDKPYPSSNDSQSGVAQEDGSTPQTPAAISGQGDQTTDVDTTTAPPPAATPSSAPQRSADLSIHLNMGIALPQTLPTGTMMGFSVEYQVQRGSPQPNTDYFWVIERARGEPFRTPVQLQRGADSTLTTFLAWRQSEGPFASHLEDASGKRISQSLSMR